MKNKVLISILLIIIMLTVQFCDWENIIKFSLLLLSLLFGGIPGGAAIEEIKVDPVVPHVRQYGDNYCAAACIDMIGRWDGWDVPYTPMQSDIMNWADDPQNGGNDDNKLSDVEVVNAVKHFAYDTCFSAKFPASSGPVKSVDDALSQAILQAGDDRNVPTIMTVDWMEQLNMGHSILIQGFFGKAIGNNVANLQKVHINDPNEFADAPDYSPADLKERMTEFWWKAPGGRYCHGIFLKPVDTASAQAIYYEYLRSCGTYYGGPEIYIPEGATFSRIRYPNGGITLANGKSDQIVWESKGLSGSIRLELYKDANLLGTIADNLPIGNGSYNWTVGQYSFGSVQDGDGYNIRLSTMDDTHEDCSNVNFSIGSVEVSSPNGGEAWEQGSLRYITWNNSYFTGNVQLLLRKTIPGTDYLIEENVNNTGIYEWTVGMCTHIDGMIIPGDCYKIKVVSMDNPDLMDSSNETFSIIEPLPPSITVNSPNGGESIVGGTPLDITWTNTGTIGNVKIEFSKSGGYTWSVIAESTENDGSYLLNLPIPNEQKDNCLIRISDVDGDPSDVSDAVFTVRIPGQ